ncbi:MAG TPA: SDR family oxidoreductase, partial [Bacteroidales bacterium]|nr:SDR family oxidoreductase [Bacteroidales bacterium]
LMITPKWVNTKTQPIAVRDVLQFLTKVVGKEETYSQSFDIGGPEVLTYKEMMQQYSEVRGLRRAIITVPVMTPRLSSYWLYFVTNTSYKLAVNLVNSMKVDVVCQDNRLSEMLGIETASYREAIRRAFERIEQNTVVSSWKDAFISSSSSERINDFIKVPEHGVFRDYREVNIKGDEQKVLENIWSLGGKNGWFYADKLWMLRGAIDKVAGGVGLRRGRTNPDEIHPGDALDFWRVIVADKQNPRLLLFAEMKLPGEAWLEFRINDHKLIQTATFRPKGLWGRFYWYSVVPFHYFIFRKMAHRIANKA